MRVIASVALTVALTAAEPAAQDAARQNEVNRDLAGVWRCERIEVDNGSRRPFMWVDQLSIDETGTHVTRDVLYQEFEDWDDFREGKVADSVSDRMSGQMSRRLESLGAAGELTGSLSSSPVAGPVTLSGRVIRRRTRNERPLTLEIEIGPAGGAKDTCTYVLESHMAEQYRDSGRGFGTLPAVVEGARAGDVRLMTELGARFESGGDFGGYRHMTGRVRWANVEEAEYWYERAATAGHAPAMRNLGLLAVRGARGNKGKGESWLEQASNAGDQTALEYDRAMRGDSTAVAALGWRYYTGANEFPRVFDETVRWSAQAMDNGSEDGYYQIGLSYELGLGPFGGRGGRDMARPFYQHAADAGHERALAALSRLGR